MRRDLKYSPVWTLNSQGSPFRAHARICHAKIRVRSTCALKSVRGRLGSVLTCSAGNLPRTGTPSRLSAKSLLGLIADVASFSVRSRNDKLES